MRPPLTTALLALCLSVAFCGQVDAQSAANALLVINEASPASLEIGSYYGGKRGVPSQNILRLRLDAGESIDRANYERQIEAPITDWLMRNFAQDRILYIILTKGIPLRISGSGGQDGTVASVDSELTLLYRKMTGQSVPVRGRVNNPYFLGEGSLRTKPFTHDEYDIYLVTRLDGYTVSDVRALIDRAGTPAKDGAIVLDDKVSLSGANVWLKSAAEILRESGSRNNVVYDTGITVVKNVPNVLGYYSWGSNDRANRERHFNLGFVNGALAAMFVSSDARTLKEPPADWKIGNWDDETTYYVGTPQSLIGDFIRDGITGAAGHVAEPYLDATIRPNILFPAYLSGANLAEAFYQAMPYLSWQTIVVGDPFCAPFRPAALTTNPIDYEQNGDFDKAIDRYRQLLETQPNNVMVLNNLAHALAIHSKTPAAALPFAEKAYGLAARNPNIADTFGWLLHLTGNNRRAKGILAEALEAGPRNSGILVHSAVVHAGLGEYDDAQKELARALELDSKLASREDIIELQKKLRTRPAVGKPQGNRR